MIEKIKWDEQPEDAAKEVQNLIDQLVDAVNEIMTWRFETDEEPAENMLTKSLRMDKEFAEEECKRLQNELDRTRKALDVAVDALKGIKNGQEPICLGTGMDINDALEQIESITKGE